MSYCLKCKKKTKSKNILYVKSKNNRVKQKVHVRCVVQKKINLSPNTNSEEIYKSFLSGSKFTTTGIPGELHLPERSMGSKGCNLSSKGF